MLVHCHHYLYNIHVYELVLPYLWSYASSRWCLFSQVFHEGGVRYYKKALFLHLQFVFYFIYFCVLVGRGMFGGEGNMSSIIWMHAYAYKICGVRKCPYSYVLAKRMISPWSNVVIQIQIQILFCYNSNCFVRLL